jgi:hypothetical protein
MKVIYPEETLALLAKYDELMDKIREDYQRTYPDLPEFLREVLGERLYREKCNETWHKRRCGILEDPYYQACTQAKAKIISMSPCTYQFDAEEVRSWSNR